MDTLAPAVAGTTSAAQAAVIAPKQCTGMHWTPWCTPLKPTPRMACPLSHRAWPSSTGDPSCQRILPLAYSHIRTRPYRQRL